MSKTKKSKLLASMLCATVVAGLYAGPVMAGAGTVSGLSADTSNGAITAKDTVTINGVKLAGDVVEAKYFKIAGQNMNGSTTNMFLVDNKGAVRAANGAFGVSADGTVSVGGDETNGKAIINGTTGDITTKGNVYAVNGSFDNITTGTITAANGSFKVEEGNGETVVAGSMVYSKNQNGSYGMLNGNQLTLQGDDGSKVSIINGNIETSGRISANDLTLAGLESENKDVATAINDLNDKYDGVDTDLGDLTGRVGTLETNTAGITNDKGVTVIDQGLKVKGEDGREVFSVARDGAINAEVTDGLGGTNANFVLNGENVELKYGTNGITANIDGTTISGHDTDIVVNENGATFTNANGTTVINGGAITADSLTLGEMNVKEAITNLQDTVGDMVVAGLPDKVAGIERNDETTTIEGTLSVSKDFIGANIEGSIFGVSDEDVTIAHGSNGIAINNMGVHLSGNVYFDGKDGNSYTLADLEDRVSNLEDKTQNITGSKPGIGEGGSTVPPTTDGHTGIEGDVTVGGEINADSGTIGGVTMEEGKLTADEATIGDVTVGGSLNVADKVTVDKDGVAVKGDGENNVKIDGNDVSVSWKDDEGNSHETSIRDNYEAINDLDNRVTSEVNRLDNRISKVEDRIDKVGAMSAAIANLRTMGYDPTAPTEIAVGIGQYRSETGAALGLFHYPNRDFMLSLSVSTSGDEVMGGIGATWKFGRKTPEQMLAAEKEKAAKAKLAKAEAMKKAAAEAKVAEQQAKHAKMAAEKAAK